MNKNSLAFALLCTATGVFISFLYLDWRLACLSSLLATAMIAIAFVDARNFVIPDLLSLPAIPLGILASLFIGSGTYDPEAAIHATLSCVGAGFLLLAVRETYRLYRGREGLGLGDVKLGFAAGAWTGFPGFTHVLLLAAVAALLHMGLRQWLKNQTISATTPIPFGAYFAPSIWLIWFAQRLWIGGF